MHGRPRQKGPPDPERVKAAQQKAALYGQLAGEVLARRAANRYDPESLGLAAKLLELNPEVYTVWNFRREALAPVLEAGGDAALTAVAEELALTQKALARNPKSYAAWHHRKWVVGHRYSSLEAELALVGMLLQADERNFHGWGYRRFVVGLMGTPAERELEYAEAKIHQNFSNYSAWHYRTTLLPQLHAPPPPLAPPEQQQPLAPEPLLTEQQQPSLIDSSSGGAEATCSGDANSAGISAAAPAAPASATATTSGSSSSSSSAMGSRAAAVPKEALDQEYELVKQAFFTEPEDQSGWFYHRWLLGCSMAHWERALGGPEEGGERAALAAVLEREAGMCQELLEVEPEAKWPLLTLVRLRELQCTLETGGAGGGTEAAAAAKPAATAAAAGAGSGRGAVGGGAADDEVADLYAQLEQVDPLRRGYYDDALHGRAQVVAAGSAVRASP